MLLDLVENSFCRFLQEWSWLTLAQDTLSLLQGWDLTHQFISTLFILGTTILAILSQHCNLVVVALFFLILIKSFLLFSWQGLLFQWKSVFIIGTLLLCLTDQLVDCNDVSSTISIWSCHLLMESIDVLQFLMIMITLMVVSMFFAARFRNELMSVVPLFISSSMDSMIFFTLGVIMN